jgi:exodeoxyribonuclease VII large subunit
MFPHTVAILTSPTGAVIRDFLNVANRRHSGLSIILAPVAVQGDGAAAEIESAIAQVNSLAIQSGSVDLLVLARGGGSLEDLAAFNSERVARAIAASALPVVSAIGHETDFTIADFVADLRAPTPSAAAELITEAQHNVAEFLAALSNRLVRAARFQLMQSRQRLNRVPEAYAHQRMATVLHRLEQRLDELGFRLENAMNRVLRQHRLAVAELAAAVLHHDPRQQLGIARASLATWQSRIDRVIDRSFAGRRHHIESLEGRLYRAAQVQMTARRSVHVNLHGQLQSLSPLAVLQRGYALVRDEQGSVVRSVSQIASGQTVTTLLGDGSFSASVAAIQVSKIQKKKKERSPST